MWTLPAGQPVLFVQAELARWPDVGRVRMGAHLTEALPGHSSPASTQSIEVETSPGASVAQQAETAASEPLVRWQELPAESRLRRREPVALLPASSSRC